MNIISSTIAQSALPHVPHADDFTFRLPTKRTFPTALSFGQCAAPVPH
jgi:hypothetical protein